MQPQMPQNGRACLVGGCGGIGFDLQAWFKIVDYCRTRAACAQAIRVADQGVSHSSNAFAGFN